ncbi:MAG: porin family protein [Desulfuromonadales bacterium]|nr:porin family protein [Desulfuromonadales bacterium]
MKNMMLLAGCLLALCSTSALAAEGGFYLGLHGGGVILEGVKNESREGDFNFEFDPGWLAGATIGYDLRDTYPNIGTGRVELEVAWRTNDLDKLEFLQPSIGASGETTVASVMLNTIGEYRENLPWLPYIGVGAGVARITLDNFTQGAYPLVDDEDTVFAYQFLAGFGYQVSSRVYLDLGYRYFALLDPTFTDVTGVKFDSEYATHNVTLGARFDF